MMEYNLRLVGSLVRTHICTHYVRTIKSNQSLDLTALSRAGHKDNHVRILPGGVN